VQTEIKYVYSHHTDNHYLKKHRKFWI